MGSLIDSQSFISMHLQHSIQNNNTGLQHLILTHTIRGSSLEFCSGHVDQVLDRLEKKLDNPFKCCSCTTEMVASCNGLLLVYHHCSLALWNPFTRRCREFPHPIPQFASRNYEPYYGFGHDHVSNDYKVVCIMDSNPMMPDPSIASEVHVYSLSLNLWRSVQDFPYGGYFMTRPEGRFLNAALHWLITLTDTGDEFEYPLLLVAFDLISEQFCVLPHPKAAKTDFSAFEVLEGCLCLLLPNRFGHEVWMMKQYGVRESWTKLYDIRTDQWVIISLRTLKPLIISKNGEKILLLHHDESNLEYGLGWHDLREQTYILKRSWDSVTYDSEVHLSRDIVLHVCIESLVSLGADK